MVVQAQLVEQHAAKYGVHAAVYSPDGDRLIYGGGMWYGQGFLTCVSRGHARPWSCVDGGSDGVDFGSLTISGLCFDASGRNLAVSAWSSGHAYHPALLYSVDSDRLSLRSVH